MLYSYRKILVPYYIWCYKGELLYCTNVLFAEYAIRKNCIEICQ